MLAGSRTFSGIMAVRSWTQGVCHEVISPACRIGLYTFFDGEQFEGPSNRFTFEFDYGKFFERNHSIDSTEPG